MFNEVGNKFFNHQILLQHTSLALRMFCCLMSKYTWASWVTGTPQSWSGSEASKHLCKILRWPSVFILWKIDPQKIFESLYQKWEQLSAETLFDLHTDSLTCHNRRGNYFQKCSLSLSLFYVKRDPNF